jgi:hypothetical protein
VQPSSEVLSTASEQSCAEQLAKFFRNAMPVRIPVQVTALRGGNARLREATLVLFSTSEHAIFPSTLPLEFNDSVRIEGSHKKRVANAAVVAVHYHEGRKAIAVKFSQPVGNWVTQP